MEVQGNDHGSESAVRGNHPGIIEYKGKSYVFGHHYELLFSIQGNRKKLERRSIGVAEMTYNDDGTIKKVPWWGKGAPVPSVPQVGHFNPYVRNEAETICWSEGLKSESSSQGGMNVYPTCDGAFIKVMGVDFGAAGAGMFTASIACDTKPGVVRGGALELRLGAADGPLVGALPVSYTGGRWTTETIAVSVATEVACGGLEALPGGVGNQLLTELMTVGAHTVQFRVSDVHGRRIAETLRGCSGCWAAAAAAACGDMCS